MPPVPRVRDDLRIDRNPDGDYTITDRAGRQLTRLSASGYFLLLQMDGLAEPAEVCARFQEQFDDSLEVSELEGWTKELSSLGVLVQDARGLQVLRHLKEKGIGIRGAAAERRGAERNRSRREEDSSHSDWFDYAVVLLNDGYLDKSIDAFERLAEADPGNVRTAEIVAALQAFVHDDQDDVPAEEQSGIGWEAFDSALKDMLDSRLCPRCSEPFEVALGGTNRCQSCGASYSGWILDQGTGGPSAE